MTTRVQSGESPNNSTNNIRFPIVVRSNRWQWLIVPLVLVASLFGVMMLSAEGEPTLITDKADYRPNETVHVTGSGFVPGQSYDIPIMRPDGSIIKGDGNFNPDYTYTCPDGADMCWDSVTADEFGNLTYDYILNGIAGLYVTKAYVTPWSGDWLEPYVALVTFTDAKPAANLDQCANGGVSDPPVQCTEANSAWQNGNLNENQAHYFEGDFVPYRAKVTDAAFGEQYTLYIQWDSTVSSDKHATDYIGDYNYTEIDADPCTDVGTNCADVDTIPVPLDPNVTEGPDHLPATADDITQVMGDITIFGATFDGISDYMYTGDFELGASTTGLIITFTADVTGTIVVAWGGHISTGVQIARPLPFLARPIICG